MGVGRTPHLPVILNQATNVNRHGLGLRKGSDNTNVCKLADRSHVRERRVQMVPENTVDCLGLLRETQHSSYVAVKMKKWPSSVKHGMANFFVCAAILISEVGARLFSQYKKWQLSFGLETDLAAARFPSHRGYYVYSPFLLGCSPNHQ